MAKELNSLTKIELNQNDIITSVNSILGIANTVVDSIFNSTTNQPSEGNNGSGSGSKFLGFIKNTLKGIGSVVESIIGIGKVGVTLAAIGMISFLAKILKTINNISNEINRDQILNNTDLILTVSDQIVKKVFDKTSDFDIDQKKLKSFNELTNSLDKFIKVSNNNAENLERNIDNTIKFVDKINTVKLENLQTATNMFEKMAEFSKSISGNFEGLADTINEKIMPLLEQLNEGLNKTNENIENGSISSNTNISTTTSSNPTNDTSSGPVNNTSNNQNMKDYTRLINEITTELSEIQKLLSNGTISVMVQ